ncbi:MAG: OsmC family protein [Gammaproteobacteria bacterium]|nr:OsmC family protein [Gammaproteobacteria bacterium]
MRCEVDGVLERQDGTTKFTEFRIRATLDVPRDTNQERAHRLLTKAEQACLITNSLSGTTHLDAVVAEAS